MKLGIAKLNEGKITTIKDYSNIRDRGEIAHILCELELIKQDLLEMWDEWSDD